MIKYLIVLSALAFSVTGCLPDGGDAPPVAKTMLYRCYTNAMCEGDKVDEVHEFCANESDSDTLIMGDAQAEDWMFIWKASCTSSQGIVENTSAHSQGQYCVNNEGNEGAWSCRAFCEPQYRECGN